MKNPKAKKYQKVKPEKKETGDVVTVEIFLSFIMADIDILLLREDDQKTDKDKLYTKEEIRKQLKKTLNMLYKLPIIKDNLNTSIFDALFYYKLKKAGFIDEYIEALKKSQNVL